MDKDKLLDSVIAKFLNGEATSEETEKLIIWLNENNSNRLQYFAAKRIWLEHHEKAPDSDLIDRMWERMELRLHGGNERIGLGDGLRFKLNFKKFAVAASILILMASTSFLGIKLNRFYQLESNTHEIHVPFGSRTSLTLPDGTKVWLNSGSNLVYNSGFSRDERVVSLSGEAFFDVVRHKNSIFMVNTQDLNIKVLGTQFNIKSYPDEATTEATLVTGKIEIGLLDKKKNIGPIILTPNQKMVYARNEGNLQLHLPIETVETLPEPAGKVSVPNTIRISEISNPQENTSWKDGKLIFKSETLENLARRLERFYNVEISFRDNSIKALKFTGTLDEVTIEEVMKAIASASSLKYEIDKNKVTLSH
jgi:transmembrane sensor